MSQYKHKIIANQAILNENIFNNFKNQSDFTSILEHVSFEQGLKYIDEIKKYKWESLPWNKFLENDKLGNPNVFNYLNQLNNITLSNFNISPTTLRYICFGLHIVKYIKHLGKKELNIVEIGGGYGGQCKILLDLLEYENINIINYTIIDLEEVAKLQYKYLTTLKYLKIKTLPYENCLSQLDSNYDLFISNYALGEFLPDIQHFYINNVLPKCKNYFITWNTRPIHDFFKTSTIIEEVPQTNPTQFKNVIITN